MKVKDLLGQQFGRLYVLRECGRDNHGRAKWLCRCDCGTLKAIRSQSLIRQHTMSCGCFHRDRAKAAATKHGHALSGTYVSWERMIARCTYPKNNRFHRYGGRGISVCGRWRKFENFLADMGDRPPGLSIDRRNNDGNYEPSNCKWSTPKEQAANRCTARRRNEERQTV